uniref:Spermatogenesis-defective protein 39 homolog n=1 Tax=Callorhinchus milii TaxID=7868 RepID=A0A4W3JLH8_CALMI
MNRNKNDEEDYWNSTKCKAFIFDDDDEFTQLKESKRAVNNLRRIVDDDEDDEDDDDVEKVTWSGERVGSEVGRERATNQTNTKYRITFTRCLSCREDVPRLCAVRDLTRAGGLGSGRVEGTEHSCRRVDECPYSLEKFRSLKDKLQLVDEAVRTHDGNVITAVLIFLNKTLSKEVLFPELGLRQGALNHFICYLKEMGREKGLFLLILLLCLWNLLSQLLHYKQHLNITDQIKKTDFVKSCIGFSFAPDDATHVEDHYTLLDRQLIIEANDKRIEAAGQMDIFKRYPRKASILNMPLITTLYYACFYHYGESEGTFSGPGNLRKTFKISDKQYVLTALAARVKLKAWNDVDLLFTTKNWLGYTKKKAPIGFHRVVDILHKNNAPVKILQEYIALVDNPELKLNLATKYKCHDIVIESYKDLKDRQQLLMYRKKVDRGSEEERKIDIILNNSQIRWKN